MRQLASGRLSTIQKQVNETGSLVEPIQLGGRSSETAG